VDFVKRDQVKRAEKSKRILRVDTVAPLFVLLVMRCGLANAAALFQPHGAVANREPTLRLPSCFSPLFSFCDEYARGRAADHEVA
jgi:hypothetical protein